MEPSLEASQRNPISFEIATVERAMQKTQLAIHEHRLALEPDSGDRVPSKMPEALRKYYEQGKWKNKDVYLWDSVLAIATQGHLLAKQAEDALADKSYQTGFKAPIPRTPVEYSKAVIDAVDVCDRIGTQVRDVVQARYYRLKARKRKLTREYMSMRAKWLDAREAKERVLSSSGKRERDELDTSLLQATRSAGGSGTREPSQLLGDIERAGGTAGGLERWSRSITAIPEQHSLCLPPASDGGGVRIDDPLQEHYLIHTINPWTQAERLTFLDKYMALGKNFRKIASFLEYKSVDDVVRFYYANKLQLKLKWLSRELNSKRRGTKRNTLVELSRLPSESRSIWNNFAHQPMRDVEVPGRHLLLPDTSWSSAEESKFVNALCRFNKLPNLPSNDLNWFWAKLSVEVQTRTPGQCREYYEKFVESRGLERFCAPGGGRKRDGSDALREREQKLMKRSGGSSN